MKNPELHPRRQKENSLDWDDEEALRMGTKGGKHDFTIPVSIILLFCTHN
jgi:hypothetical protein